MAAQPTGNVTFLFTDVEGSTKLWDAHGPAMGAALRAHDEALRVTIEANGGHVFKTVGDAFCAAFQTPGDALSAAVETQRALAARDWGEIGAIRVRIALHTGEAEERDADYFGPPVNRVARLLSAGHGGQVLLSRATVEALGGNLGDGIALRDMGDRRLKDLTEPERVYQLGAPGLAEDFPPLKSLDARPNNLPVQPTELLGRDAELAAIKERLRAGGARLLTLTGPGGTGKTRLALQAAADLIDDFPHGVWFVDLSAVADPALVPAEIANALGVREEGTDPIERQLRAYLRDKELLLVLDNFEQVLPAAKPLSALRSDCPGVQLLVTSRAPLRISGEQEYAVPPLGVPDLRRLPDPEHLLGYPAVELFAQRAAAVKHDFGLTADNAPAVAEICVALDGLPLAIELAAARVRMLSPQAMLGKLENRLKLLTGGARDKAERQQTLRGTIAWSYDLLPEPERVLFARLAVFAGGSTFEAAEAVCNPDGDLDLFEGMEQLVQHSLVRQEDAESGESRFRMLATIREFAAEQLEERGEAEAMRQAHADHFLALAEEAEPELKGAEQATWLNRLETEHDNLRAVLKRSQEQGGSDPGLRLAGALWRFWWVRGHLSEGRGWLERTLQRHPGLRTPIRSKALKGAGVLIEMQGDYDRAAEFYEASLDLSRDLGDRLGIAEALSNLGGIACQQGDFERAVELWEEALALDRQTGDRQSIATSLANLASVAYYRQDHVQAESLFQESLDLYRVLGDQRGVGSVLNTLSAIALARGEFRRAQRLSEESLDLARLLEDKQGIAISLGNLGHSVQRQGEVARAESLYDEALDLFKELGDTRGIAFMLSHLGMAAQAVGNHGRAKESFAMGLALSSRLGEKPRIAECLEGLAKVAVFQAEPDRAARLFGAADALREESEAPLAAVHRADYDENLAAARAALAPHVFDAEWSDGHAQSLAEVIAYALEGAADSQRSAWNATF